MSEQFPPVVRLRPVTVLAVAAGTAVGAVARWLLGELVPDPWPLPTTTLLINVAGSLLLALLVTRVAAGRTVRMVLGSGVLGGFTTLSATSEQARYLIADQQPGWALGYLALSLAAALVGVHLGARLGRVLGGGR